MARPLFLMVGKPGTPGRGSASECLILWLPHGNDFYCGKWVMVPFWMSRGLSSYWTGKAKYIYAISENLRNPFREVTYTS